MADLWLERELARQLAPVAAPDSLWARINRKQRRRVRLISPERTFWPVAVAMALLALAGVLRTFSVNREPDPLPEQELALLARPSGQFDFRSNSFAETRAWVKAQANIDIDVPAGQPAADRGAVRLLGTRIVRLHGLPVAAIDYRVGDQWATLFVSGKRAGLTGSAKASKHLLSQGRLVSWNMRSETYTIAYSAAGAFSATGAFPGTGNSRGACLLCHANSPGVILME
jgi:hypothetical protein